MLVLDENLPAGQRLLLRRQRIHFRFVGEDLATSGADDENLLPILHRLPQPTFFTLDSDFFRQDWTHPNYCLAWLDVRRAEAAEFIRGFLRHASFNTQARRMGTVVRVHSGGVVCWRAKLRSPQSFAWPGK